MNAIYLEGTKDLLKNIDPVKKKIILELYYKSKINRPGKLFGGLTYMVKTLLKIDMTSARNILLEISDFYSKNIPVGWVRIDNSWELINKTGTILRFNRRKANDKLLNIKGYQAIQISLLNNGAYTTTYHRILANTFIPNPENKPQVNHIDGNKTNNNLDNLEWVTNLENIRHAWATGLRDTAKMKEVGNGEKNSQALLTEQDIIAIRKNHKELLVTTIDKIAKDFNVTTDKIQDVLDNKVKENLPRYMVSATKVNSRNTDVKFSINKLCCKDSNSHIRGLVGKIVFDNNLSLSSKYNVSPATIRDIISRRTWDYITL